MFEGNRLKIFISHSWRDKSLAEQLAKPLGDFCDVWMDYRKLRPGDVIQEEIDPALLDSDLVLLVWSANAGQSTGVSRELDTCFTHGRRIIPCVFHYDESGEPQPPLAGRLADLLAVDFHHFGAGLARLTGYIFELQTGDDEELEQDPRMALVKELDSLLNYLANYRNARDIDSPRMEWVDRIVSVVEAYLRDGGDTASVGLMLEAARSNRDSDSEALGELVSRLELALEGRPCLGAAVANVAENEQKRDKKRKKKNKTKNKKKKNRRKGVAEGDYGLVRDELAGRIAALVPEAATGYWAARIDYYIDCAGPVLASMQAYVMSVGSAAGCEVVNYLRVYLDNADDLIPDSRGRYGLVDDAWLILNTCWRLLEGGLIPAHMFSVDWQELIEADQMVTAVMPPQVLSALQQYLLRMLMIIAAEVQAYDPQFGSDSMSGGASYADRWYEAGCESIQNL